MCERRKKWRGRGQRGEKGERDEVEKFWLMMRIQRGERKRESGDEEKIISSTNGSEEGKPRLCVMILKSQQFICLLSGAQKASSCQACHVDTSCHSSSAIITVKRRRNGEKF